MTSPSLPVVLSLPAAFHRGRFRRQNLAAYFGPGQADDGADLVLLIRRQIAELLRPKQLGYYRGVMTTFGSRSGFSLLVALTTFRAILRQTFPTSRSRFRTPDSRV